jgi:hypothetical protein
MWRGGAAAESIISLKWKEDTLLWGNRKKYWTEDKSFSYLISFSFLVFILFTPHLVLIQTGLTVNFQRSARHCHAFSNWSGLLKIK